LVQEALIRPLSLKTVGVGCTVCHDASTVDFGRPSSFPPKETAPAAGRENIARLKAIKVKPCPLIVNGLALNSSPSEKSQHHEESSMPTLLVSGESSCRANIVSSSSPASRCACARW